MRCSHLHAATLGLLVTLSGCARTTTGDPTEYEVIVPQDRYAEVNGITLHYLDWGGDGDLMLFIPGLSHTAHTYDAIAPAFRDRYHVVAVTRREHGASEKPGVPVDLDILVDDLSAFMSLMTDGPTVLVGQSYAGLEMPRLTKRHPQQVRALIFLDAVYDWPGWLEEGPAFPGYFDPQAAYDSYDALESWFSELYPEMWNEAARAHLVSQTKMSHDGQVTWHFPVEGPLWGRFLEVNRTWTPDEFADLERPVLSIQAEQGEFMALNLLRVGATAAIDTARAWADELDNVFKRRGREMLADRVPHAVLLQYNATHHWLHLQSPGRVIRDINAFLDTELQ